MASARDPFNALSTLEVGGKSYRIARLKALEEQGICKLSEMPISIRVLLESVLRNVDGETITREDVVNAASWKPEVPQVEIPFMPARVVLQDFTGVAAVVDLAALRTAAEDVGKDPQIVNPLVPCDLVIDHSVQVDFFGAPEAFDMNVAKEYERNSERYQLLKWAQKAFDNFHVVPPGTGIVHQVNLEHLGRGVWTKDENGETWAFPDTLVGTDSHTTMIGGIGVVGWGVGGIEAEANMLGQPYFMKLPDVIGVRLTGKLAEGTTATDLVLHVTETLRKVGVVDKFVEFTGPGLSELTVADRATIANMAPEQGSTISFFPIDEKTLEYMRLTGRSEETIALVEAYCKEQGLWGAQEPKFTQTVDVDLATVEPSLAGPRRPQDRVPMPAMGKHFRALVHDSFKERVKDVDEESINRWREEGGHPATVLEPTHPDPDLGHLTARVKVADTTRGEFTIGHGSVVIAAITSCTNTSNPSVMIAAGLVAKKAVELGLDVKPFVKTSLAPGSRVVTEYLQRAGVLEYLEKLRFHNVAYGCTTCIGNAGPLPEAIEKAILENDLIVSSVLSGNRNFEARIHPHVRANYLASPPLVVAYALAGRTDVDLSTQPLGIGATGDPVYLKDVWPTRAEIQAAVAHAVTPEMFREKYASVFEGDERWQALDAPGGLTYDWDRPSTYVANPPFFQNFPLNEPTPRDIEGARVLALLGDTVTTDHISPAGSFGTKQPAGQYLKGLGVPVEEFNTYGTRRGNHEVMMRGTFANVRIKNKLVPGIEGGFTVHLPSGEQTSIFEASERYRQEGTPLLVIGGKEYGTGSSRDWAAKGTMLLGVKAVLVESYERIHRSNLIGMGVLPLQFKEGESAASHGLDGTEVFSVRGITNLQPRAMLTVEAKKADGSVKKFEVVSRLDTAAEVKYYKNGGILHTVLRRMLTSA